MSLETAVLEIKGYEVFRVDRTYGYGAIPRPYQVSDGDLMELLRTTEVLERVYDSFSFDFTTW
jgi:hypothetical protein